MIAISRHSVCAVCALFAVSAAFAAGEVEIRPGRVRVVIAPDASKVVRFAADEMTNYLSRILGAAVPLADAPADGIANIVLGVNGWSRRAKADPSALPVDSFITDVRANAGGSVVIIAGVDDPVRDIRADMLAKRSDAGPLYERATVFGVYAFLEKYAGCRFYFPGELGEIVPRRTSLRVPCGRTEDVPAYEKRTWNSSVGERVNRWFDDPSYAKSRWAEYAFRSQLQLRRSPTTAMPCHGTRFHYLKDRFAKDHPEYFAMAKGRDGVARRVTDAPWNRSGLCWSSRVTDEICRTVKCYLSGGVPADVGIAAQPNPEGYRGWHPQGFARGLADIDPEDGMAPCVCDACRAAYRLRPDGGHSSGSMSDLIWSKSASIANEVRAAGIEGRLMQIAYGNYTEVPKGVAIPENLIVNVACNGPWAMGSPERRKIDIDLIRRWSEHGGKKVYLHNWVLKNARTQIPDLPSTTPRLIGGFYRAVAPYANGVYMESGSDRFAHIYLNIYVASKVTWDPSFDYEAALDEHHRLMFGAAAPEMKEFYDGLEELWGGKVAAGECEMGPLGPILIVPSQFEMWRKLYSAERLARWQELFRSAAAKTAPGSLEARRVELMRVNLLGPVLAAQKRFADWTSVEREEARRKSAGVKNLLGREESFAAELARADLGTDHERSKGLMKLVPFRFEKGHRYRLSFYLKTEDVHPSGWSRFIGALVALREGRNGPGSNWLYTFGDNAVIGDTYGWAAQSIEIDGDKSYASDGITMWLRGSSGRMAVKGLILEEVGK